MNEEVKNAIFKYMDLDMDSKEKNVKNMETISTALMSLILEMSTLRKQLEGVQELLADIRDKK
jgi:hypothetical protein